MTNLAAMIWVEARKAVRSPVVLGTMAAVMCIPLIMGFMTFAATHFSLSSKLGLLGGKADLATAAAMDWQSYTPFAGLLIAGAGFFFFVVAISWLFGREFADGTVKEWLAVPVPRTTILLAKFIVAALWSAALASVMAAAFFGVGLFLKLPGDAWATLPHYSRVLGVTSLLAIATTLPFAWLASVGRGYLLPLGVALLMTILINMMSLTNWGHYLPWAIPGLFAQGDTPLSPLSYTAVLATMLGGIAATFHWWLTADQN